MNTEGSYSDTLVKADIRGKRLAIRRFLIVLCEVMLLASIVLLATMGGIIVFVIVLLIDGIIVYFLPSKAVEYEYVYVDGQIDFDRIISGNNRKNMLRTDLEKVIKIAPQDSHSLDGYKDIKQFDYSSSNDEDKHYIIVTKTDKENIRIKFTPDERLLGQMKSKSPSKIEY